MILDPTQYVQTLLKSPLFAPSKFDSSHVPTQYTDAVQKAEFYTTAGAGWHTYLTPVVAKPRTMVLIRGTYHFAVDRNGNLLYVLVDAGAFGSALFPPTPSDTTTVMGAAENAGDIHTTDLSILFFANTFLYEGNTGNCCILGYHSYDLEPGDAGNGFRERRYVMSYASWVTTGLFGTAFADITALSHELAEAFNDPFGNNATPIWAAPNGLCQNNLEVGDVIEGLPNATTAIDLNGFTYHVQNVALLPWFAGVQSSKAIDNAYSYPDTSVLTAPATSLFSDCSTPAQVPP